ncbi:MAG: hypothetical protein ACE5NG_01490 [bacterium]
MFFLFNRIRRTVQRIRRKEVKRISLTQNTFRLILILFWITVSAAGLFLAAFIQSYQSFTREELVASVRCVPFENKQRMQMELTMTQQGQNGITRRFILNGDQWAVEGDILKWDNWMNFMGLHTMYKLTRVRGRFVTTREEVSHSPSAYSLVEKEEDPNWRWLYKYGHKLPFVTAVYGNTVFTYPSDEYVYEIYVTTSGFIAKIREE